MFSSFLIRRPIFACVLSLIIMLAGVAAMGVLPVEQYPQIVPPQVQVVASYPGASAEVIANTVAAPLEQAINGVDDMLYVQSISASNGQLTLNATFKIGTSPDQATINVNNRVQSALAQLPEEVRRQGVSVRKQSAAFLQVIALYAEKGRYDTLYMSNYALLNVVDELKRIPGVGDVINFAGRDYSMRIWLKPDRLAQLKLTPSDVVAAIREQNAQFAAGKLGAEPSNQALDFTYTVTTRGRMSTPEEFSNIIVRANPDGSAVLLKEVAKVELGALNYDFNGKINGDPMAPIGIFLAPGANQLETAKAVKDTMARLSGRFPDGLKYRIPFDSTKFVEVSIEEVYKTLAEAMALVFLVVFLFLQNWRATLIPCLAVPVSIVGTFAGMYAFGFSINLLTLFGMVLAIGIVVDDAIVVLENVERIMSEAKVSATEATLQAMKEVSGPVVAIVLVLCSVFVPVAFLGGIAGQMYKQFAITIAISVSISGLVALTLTPALCALILRPGHQSRNRFFDWFNRSFDAVGGRYVRGVAFLSRRSALGLALFGLLLLVSAWLFRAIPTSLAPDEDQGYVIAAAFLPDGASLQRTAKVMDKLDHLVSRNPAVKDMLSMSGFDIVTGGKKTNAGVSFIQLQPWEERRGAAQSAQAVVGDIFAKTGAGIRDGFIFAVNPPPISGMSNTGGFEGYLQNRNGASPAELEGVSRQFLAAAAKRPELAGVQTTYSASVPQVYIELNRAKAKALGVPINTVFDTLQSTLGELYVNDFNKFGRTFRVQLQSEASYRSHSDNLAKVFVRSTSGAMVPVTALLDIQRSTGPEVLERYNLYPSAKLIGGPAPGYSSGEALAAMEQVAKETLPDGYALAWTGSALQEKAAGGSSAKVFLFGIVVVFLILAAQYERWTLPLAVLLAVPFAVFGALVANWTRGLANDIYFQVALVTLIGLSAKNAILIVEFAMLKLDEGMELVQATMQAARMRFRPIVMTSLAFVLGCVPLAVSSGAGSASRHSIGTGVIGGMLAATFIATFFIPLFFILIMKAFHKKAPAAAAAEEEVLNV
ncbi:efflux RND transporter permease subunit [Chromobacterium subtsugae]|uniref:efflux RND transporter permease subunit n=1 Tax=Chromobacterium subtsugae TaxID=251747 RepID=UPI0006410E7F|nr:multidrug efflux RND transporter permease subunit [Chromobacterium subtsugae]